MWLLVVIIVVAAIVVRLNVAIPVHPGTHEAPVRNKVVTRLHTEMKPEVRRRPDEMRPDARMKSAMG